MKKWFQRIGLILIAFSFLVIVFVHAFFSLMHYSENDVKAFFGNQNFQITSLEFKERKLNVLAEVENAQDSVLIIFIHGAPGSWDAFKDYLQDPDLNRRGRIIGYDRPGYNNDTSMPKISDQTEALLHIIEKYKLPKVVLIGHSYGATIAAHAATGYPEIIDQAIILAPLLDPQNEPIFWFSYFAHWKATKWLLPHPLKVAGDEKFAHAKELALIDAYWSDLKIPVYHIHGEEDILAPAEENIQYVKNNFPAEYMEQIILPNKGHIFIWTAF